MKRGWLLSAGLLALGTVASNGVVAEQTLYTIGATGQASSFYAYHVGVAQLLKDKLGYQATVQETGGASDNKKLLERGQVDWAQFAEPDFFEFYKGLGKWEGNPQPDFRVFWVVNPIAYFPVVNKDMGIRRMEDLQGKAFNPGGRGSATERMTQDLLTMLGIEPEWFRAGYSDAVAAIKDRRVAGYMKAGSTSAPDASIMDVGTAVPIDILSWSDEHVAKIKAKYPWYDFVTLETTPYGIGPVNVRAVFFIMGTTSKMPEEEAYKIVKTIAENVAFQGDSYPAIKGRDVARETLARAQAPLHMGTIRYLRELGLTVPDRLLPPEAK